MVSVSRGEASFSPLETLEEKNRREELEASRKSKNQEQKSAPDTKSAAQKNKEQIEQARTGLPGTTRTTQSSDNNNASSTSKLTNHTVSSQTTTNPESSSGLSLFRLDHKEQEIKLRSLQINLSNAINENGERITDNYHSIGRHFNNPDLKKTTWYRERSPQQEQRLLEYQNDLQERQKLIRTSLQVNELIAAREYDKAQALLEGRINLTNLEEEKLKIATNPNAEYSLKADGTKKTDKEVIDEVRSFLKEQININKSSLETLEKEIDKLTKDLGKPANRNRTEKALTLEEKKGLLEIQKQRLTEETLRMFQAHDKITNLHNEDKLQEARDIAEGRKAVLNENEKAEQAENSKSLLARDFIRTKNEDFQYAKAQTALIDFQNRMTNIGILSDGTKIKIEDTRRDIQKNSGLFDELGGHSETLRQTHDAEKQHLTSLEQQSSTLNKINTAAEFLIKQGQYQEAEKLLADSNKLASKKFQESNKEMQAAYKKANESLANFDRNLKDAGIKVAKTAAISAVAAALAIPTGGASIVALGASLGTATLAGLGTGVAIDAIDAAINVGAFGDNIGDASLSIVDRQKVYDNFKTALFGAVGGIAGRSISGLSSLERFGLATKSLVAGGGSSSLATTMSLTEQRIQAEIEFKTQEAQFKANNISKEEFMSQKGLSAEKMAKSLLINSSVGSIGGILGLRSGAAIEATKSTLKRGGIEAAEEFANSLVGLAGSFVENDGRITAQNLADEIASAAIGSKVGKTTRSNPTRDSEPKIITNINLPEGIQAQTTIKYDNNGKPISIISSVKTNLTEQARLGDSEALSILREETESHAREKPLDPLNKADGTPREKPLTQEAYSAIRAQRELAMQSKGRSLQTKTEGNSVSPGKQALKKPLQQMTQLISEGKHKEALKIAKTLGINDTYLQQYKKDYEYNIDPNRKHLEQTSFSAKLGKTPTEFIKSEISDSWNKETLDETRKVLLELYPDLKTTIIDQAKERQDFLAELYTRTTEKPRKPQAQETQYQFKVSNHKKIDSNIERFPISKKKGFYEAIELLKQTGLKTFGEKKYQLHSLSLHEHKGDNKCYSICPGGFSDYKMIFIYNSRNQEIKIVFAGTHAAYDNYIRAHR